MKKLDLYIIKKFLGTFIFSISLLLVIVIIIDISEKMDQFMGVPGNPTATVHQIIFEYYLNFIPYFLSLFGPLFTFIAVIFFTSRLAYRTEIIAILSSGISFKRFLMPYIFSSVLLTLFNIYLNNYLIPPANRVRLNFENTYLNYQYRSTDKHIHLQIEKDCFVYLDSYNNISQLGYKFSYEKFKNDELVYKLMADYIKWDSVKKHWEVNQYWVREINGTEEKLKQGFRVDTAFANLEPQDFYRNVTDVATMDYSELSDFIKREKLKGVDKIGFYQIEMYKRFAFPFANIILTLIGVSISSRKVRGGIGMHMGLGLALSFTYILFTQVSSTFSTHGNLHPLIGTWIPNIVYLIIAIYLMKKAPK